MDIEELKNIKIKELELDQIQKRKRNTKETIVIDGKVFSTEAGNRGMGRYLNSIIKYLCKSDLNICLILYKNFDEKYIESVISNNLISLKYIDLDPTKSEKDDIHRNSYAIDIILKELNANYYLDSTPFLSPARFDITYCPVIIIAYDLIPLRYPRDYLYYSEYLETYKSALDRIKKADSIIAISKYTKDHLIKYLGIDSSKVTIIYPSISNEYLNQEIVKNNNKSNIFAIVGGHKSKNPERSLILLDKLSQIHNSIKNIKVCVPTLSQFKDVTTKYNKVANNTFEILYNITEENKINFQKTSKIVAHLSIEEGFGIPLVEALFLNANVVVMDTELNREIINYSENSDEIAVFLNPDSVIISEDDSKAIINLLGKYNEDCFNRLKSVFLKHWENADKTMLEVCKLAKKSFDKWNLSLKYYMVSNTPYNFCGVADYCSSFPTVSENNSVVYTKDEYVKKINAFINLKIKSFLSFTFDQENINLPVIYNLAFSDSLSFGVEFLRLYGRSKDITIFHDMAYLYGLYYYYFSQNKLDEFYKEYFIDEDKPIADVIKTILEGDKNEIFERFMKIEKLYSSAWLRSKKCKLICQTPLVKDLDFKGFNSILRNSLTYVPMGIDDRSKSVDIMSSNIWRNKNNIRSDDIIFAVIGSVTSNKFLVEVSQVLSKLIPKYEINGRKIYFLITGKVIDKVIYNQMLDMFKKSNILDRIIQVSPVEEVTLDSLIVASDAVICLRKQDRVQLSHSFVRSLSLGKPIISTYFTGFYDKKEKPSLLTESIYESINKFLILTSDNKTAVIRKLSQESRANFENNHNIKMTLNNILSKNNE